MSGNDEEKSEVNKVFPLDLASKITVKPGEIPKAQLVMTGQPIRRILTQAGAVSVSGSNPGIGQTISIVPQAMIKQGLTSNHGQTQVPSTGLTVARPAQITLATSVVGQSQTGGATYHVPRGPAVVANLATPRSAVATPIRAPGIVTTPPGSQPSGFVTAVRQVNPSRTPSPANSGLPAGTTWLSSTGMQVQSGGQIKSIVSSVGNAGGSVVSSGNTAITANLQRIPPSSGGNAPAISRTQIVARAQSNSAVAASAAPRQAVLHSAITIGQTNPQIHSFKPAPGIQAIGSAVTLAQVLPTRTQTLVYSAGNTPHFAASPRIAVTGAMNTQRQVTAARPTQVMATRLAVPVSVSQGSTRLTVTPGQGTLYTTGARLSTVPAPAQNTVIGTTNTRIAVTNSQQPTAVGRLSVSSPPGALLTTTQARLTVANPTQQPPSAVVIGTQPGTRLAASVVSLHPVVVANSSQAARTIQTQGPKVITQPAQGPAIQLAQVPTVAKLPTQQQVVPVTVVAATSTTRTINVTPAAIVSQRPVAVTSGTQAIPIAKVFPQGNRVALETSDGSNSVQQTNQPTNVYIHAAPMVRRPTSPGPGNSGQTEAQRTPVTTSVTTYISSGTTYYYETGSGNGYTVAGVATRAFTPSSASFAAVPQSANTQIRTTQVHGIMSGQPIQFNPVMVVGQKSSGQFLETSNTGGLLQQSPTPSQQDHGNPLPSIVKVTSSPRPSILRKRDNEGLTSDMNLEKWRTNSNISISSTLSETDRYQTLMSALEHRSPLKAAKNLAPVLANLSSAPASPPSRPDSRGNGGNSSGGSTTISATSSPGLGEHEDSLPLPPAQTPPSAAAVAQKLELQQQQQQLLHHEEDRPTPEMSPRKKPRKQQLIGNDEPKFNMEDMQFLSENKIKKEPEEHLIPSREPVHESRHNNEVTVKKPAPASLLNSYRQTWKSTHNHYLRYTDVKPKDERRPTIIDLANQNQVLQKINGWKIHHLSAQMEDMSDLETQVYDKLSSMLKLIETKDCSGYDKDFNRINELIKGNMQRSKIINDSTVEAKTQVMKIFDHREHVADIINRCASKRNFKKRDKC